MARAPRSVLPEYGTFHVVSRGVARQSIYEDDDDRRFFVRQLTTARRKYHWLVYAYCLMRNHYHLVVVSDLHGLSRGMHLINFRYAEQYNERYARVGHLFQGRFGARAIEGDEHFITVCGYVFDNPVRAGLCDARAEWPWLGGELLADLR